MTVNSMKILWKNSAVCFYEQNCLKQEMQVVPADTQKSTDAISVKSLYFNWTKTSLRLGKTSIFLKIAAGETRKETANCPPIFCLKYFKFALDFYNIKKA